VVFEAEVEGVRRKSGGLEGGAPGGEEACDGVLGDSGEGDEFGARGRATSAACDGGDGIENMLFVGRWSQSGCSIY